jgi:hypothetical protein
MEDLQHKIHACGCSACRRGSDPETAEFHKAIHRVMVELNERDRRRLGGLLAHHWGHGGIQRVLEITGQSRKTIHRGCRELAAPRGGTVGRIRRPGGGRKCVEKKRLRS